jgi:hypothetical protein
LFIRRNPIKTWRGKAPVFTPSLKPIKIRSEAKLKNLSDRQQAQVAGWIKRMPLRQAQAKVREKLKMSVGISTLSEFYSWYFLVKSRTIIRN